MSELLPPLNLYVVPCGAAKTTAPAPARDLYTGGQFRYVLDRVEREAAMDTAETGTATDVMILSALHGLLDLDDPTAPYDVTMRDPGSIPVERLAAQLALIARVRKVEVYAFLPAAYHQRLRAAADILNADDSIPHTVLVHDVYEAAPGIGYQRGVAACIAK